MAIKGSGLGWISMALAIIFLVLLVFSMLAPGPSTLSTGAVVVGVGTVVAVISLGVGLLMNR